MPEGTGYVSALGLSDNPFAEYVAENEPNLDKYLITPPYVGDCLDRATMSRSFVLFGARGAGKSATRIAVARRAWDARQSDKAALVVTMDDFGAILSGGLDSVSAEGFVQQAGFLAVESILLWLAAMEEDERLLYISGRTPDEERLCVQVVAGFYLSRPEHVRQHSARATAQLLQYSLKTRVGSWVNKRWSSVVDLVSQLAVAIGKATAGVDAAGAAPAIALLAGGSSRPPFSSLAGYERAALEKLVEFARVFEFSGLEMLIDKADETQYTSNSAEGTAKLLYPLLSNIPLLEVEGAGWGLFLWDRVRSYYSDGNLRVRLDKLPSPEIRWDNDLLLAMVDRRISYFSQGRVAGLRDLLAEEPDPETALEAKSKSRVPTSEILDAAMRSPRAVIRVMDSIIKEHVDMVENGKVPTASNRLPAESVERGLDRYCTSSIRDGFEDSVLQQVLKLGKTVFANKDVQEAFRIGSESARAKIQRWVDIGLVDRTGTRPAEGDAGGKPAYEYSIVEARLRRIVARGLSLGTQFDLGLEALSVVDDG
ncbi:MAG: hypothetical protein K8H88_03120 [Sandaracinaceae bacterium]|nr:hypothetical protein [Sandaracinaceae bacterium]